MLSQPSTPTSNQLHQWLGIPLIAQPPNHYRLLAISPFERNPNVIEIAARGRILALSLNHTDDNSKIYHQILMQIKTARLCLLNPTLKATYDQALRLSLTNAGQDLPAKDYANPWIELEFHPETERLRSVSLTEPSWWILGAVLAVVLFESTGLNNWAHMALIHNTKRKVQRPPLPQNILTRPNRKSLHVNEDPSEVRYNVNWDPRDGDTFHPLDHLLNRTSN